jgi:hypothetical protein
LLSQKLLETFGCVDKRPLAAVTQNRCHEKFPVSRINTKFDDVVAQERDAAGLHVANIRIVSASHFHGLRIASVVLVLLVQAVQFEIWSNRAIGPKRAGTIFGAIDLPGDKRPAGITGIARSMNSMTRAALHLPSAVRLGDEPVELVPGAGCASAVLTRDRAAGVNPNSLAYLTMCHWRLAACSETGILHHAAVAGRDRQRSRYRIAHGRLLKLLDGRAPCRVSLAVCGERRNVETSQKPKAKKLLGYSIPFRASIIAEEFRRRRRLKGRAWLGLILVQRATPWIAAQQLQMRWRRSRSPVSHLKKPFDYALRNWKAQNDNRFRHPRKPVIRYAASGPPQKGGAA